MSSYSLQEDLSPQQLITPPATLPIPQSSTLSSSSLPNVSIGHSFQDKPLTRPAVSRPASHASTKPTASLSSARNQSQDRSGTTDPNPPPSFLLHGGSRNTIIKSFAPRIAVYASFDTQNFAQQKGFQAGFAGMLRPYGEKVQGNVVIRDSAGSSRAHSDFGVRFFNPLSLEKTDRSWFDSEHEQKLNPAIDTAETSHVDDLRSRFRLIEQVLDLDLGNIPFDFPHADDPSINGEPPQPARRQLDPPLFQLYLRRLLSHNDQVPYETFGHPVACLIAVSSRNDAPLEALRRLYAQTSTNSSGIPSWIGNEFLRYYVLVHDEENDDIAQSTALFDLMKRNFGLNCHLLRLKSSQCVMSDDDSAAVPLCEWLSAEEELGERQNNGKLFVSVKSERLDLPCILFRR